MNADHNFVAHLLFFKNNLMVVFFYSILFCLQINKSFKKKMKQ